MTLRDKLKFWILLSSYVEMIVRGTSPLSLPNAIVDSLEYLKAFGGTELVPETYLDSVTADGKCEQRNLPANYIQRQYIYMQEGSYLLTDIVPTYDGHYELDFQTTTISSNPAAYLGGRADQSPAGLIFSHGSGVPAPAVADAFGQRYSITHRPESNTRYKYVFNNKVFTLYKDGEVVETYTFTSTNNSGAALAIKAINTAGSIEFANEGIYLYGFKAWNAQGELIADYVPAVQKGTVPVVGFYDTVSGTFKTATAGTFAAGGEAVPTPDAPMDIVSNNGVLKAHPNLFDKNSLTLGYIDDAGDIQTSTVSAYSAAMPVLPNTTYVLSGLSFYAGSAYLRIHGYNNQDVWTSMLKKTNKESEIINPIIFTTGNSDYYVRFSYVRDNMLNALFHRDGVYTVGTVETIEDTSGNTATAEMLCSVGNYKDTQEILSGSVTRNVGIKVLDGTEDWTYNNSAFLMDLTDRLPQKQFMYCTHFNYDSRSSSEISNLCIGGAGATNTIFIKYQTYNTAEQFKQYLADQYAAGTPVIIVYPLATATTESVAGQTLLKAPLTTAGSLENLVVTPTSSSHTVPTPTQPLDINSNNGALKARHQSGLPLGYTLLEYIQGDGTAYIDLGISLTQDDEFELDFIMPSSNISMQNIFGYRDSASSNAITAMIASSSNAFVTDFNDSDYPPYRLLTNISASTEYKVITNKNSRVLYQGDTLVSSNTTLCEDTITTGNALVFNIGGSPAYTNKFTGSISRVIVKNRINLIPVKRNSDSVLGMYDIINDVFYTNAGTGTFTAGTAVSDPVEVYADGTVETINVHGKNLFDVNNYIEATIASDGTITQNNDNNLYIMNVVPNNSYIFNYTPTGTIVAGNCLYGYSKELPTIGGTATYNIITIGQIKNNVFTVPDGYHYLVIRLNKTSFVPKMTDIQLERGTTATTYEPYYNGGTATAEMLLKVGDYEDMQEILSGAITRNVGVKVLDGTENWDYQTQVPDVMTIKSVVFPDDFYSNPNNNVGYCNYYTVVATSTSLSSVLTSGQMGWNTTGNIMFKWTGSGAAGVASFKQWLATQYANGTPVTVVYPLATPTTETVTGQPMQVQQGDNIVEITQASMNNLELEAKYKKQA